MALGWVVAGAVGPQHSPLVTIGLQPICRRMVTTSKHCRGWGGSCREALMEIPTETHQNEAAILVFNFAQTGQVLNWYLA